MEKNSRQKLIEFLQSRPTASAIEISRVLKTTPSNVRHHLSVLLEEGVLLIVGERHSSKRGRPVQLFALSMPFTQHNLDRLSGALLGTFLETNRTESNDQFIQQVARRIADPAPETHQLTQRLNQVVQRLNKMGYQARWEAHASGPRVISGHCPYKAILNDYPVICQFDTAIISELTERIVSLESKLEPGSSGLPQCVFKVGNRK